MADQKRNTPSRQQPRSEEVLDPRDPELERSNPTDRHRSTPESPSVARDSGRGRDEGGTRFEQNRASDELGSEAERESGISELDDEDVNGPSDR